MTFHNEYLVRWEIDIEADSPEEAARQAFELMQNPTTATVFDVYDEDGHLCQIDLIEIAEEPLDKAKNSAIQINGQMTYIDGYLNGKFPTWPNNTSKTAARAMDIIKHCRRIVDCMEAIDDKEKKEND